MEQQDLQRRQSIAAANVAAQFARQAAAGRAAGSANVAGAQSGDATMVYSEQSFRFDRVTCSKKRMVWLPLYDAFGSALSLVCVGTVGGVESSSALPTDQGPLTAVFVRWRLGWTVAGNPSRGTDSEAWFAVPPVTGGEASRQVQPQQQSSLRSAGPFGSLLAVGLHVEAVFYAGTPVMVDGLARDFTVTIGAQWLGGPAQPLATRAS